MHTRHPRIPTIWLMTDERMGDRLWAALDQLPPGAGVIFRHYGLSQTERCAMAAAVSRIARRRRLVLITAGDARLVRHSDGQHGRILKRTGGIKTWPAHNTAEIIAGLRAKADRILISPVFATRSHAGVRPLGIVRAANLARRAKGRAIALGGIVPNQVKRLKQAGFAGWAAIDAWMPLSP